MALVWRNYRFRIYPDSDQIIKINEQFGFTRFVYNHFVKQGQAMFESVARYPTYQENLASLPELINNYSFLRLADRSSLELAVKNLSRAYENHKTKPGYNPPRFKSVKDSYRSFTFEYQSGNKLINRRHIILPGIGSVKIIVHRNIARCMRPKHITVFVNAANHYFASLALFADNRDFDRQVIGQTTADLVESGSNVKRAIGLDFSIPEMLVDSNGEKAGYPHYYSLSMKKLSREQRKMSLCQRGSKNYEKQRIRAARLNEHCTNQRKDFQHKLSRRLVDQNDLIGIETISIKSMVKDRYFGRKTYDDSWYNFTMFLDYKMTERYKPLVKLDRWFPSSKRCSKCGRIKSKLSLEDRVYRCSCGYVGDRDLNAAINICNESLRIYRSKQNLPVRPS